MLSVKKLNFQILKRLPTDQNRLKCLQNYILDLPKKYKLYNIDFLIAESLTFHLVSFDFYDLSSIEMSSIFSRRCVNYYHYYLVPLKK